MAEVTIHVCGAEKEAESYLIPGKELILILEAGSWELSKRLDYCEDGGPQVWRQAKAEGWKIGAWLREMLGLENEDL